MFDKEPNIDIVFRNGLKEFEVLPPPEVWDEIPPVKPIRHWKRNIYPIAATIAILMTLGMAFSYLFKKQIPTGNQLAENKVFSKPQMTPASAGNTYTESRIIRMQPVELASDPESEAKSVSVSPEEKTISLSLNPAVLPLKGSQPALSNDKSKKLVNRKVLQDINVPAFYNSDYKNYAAVEPSEKKNKSKLMIGGSMSPAYSVMASGGKGPVSDLMKNERSVPTYTGGVSVGMNVSKRLIIQTGVNLTTMGQTVMGINVYAGLSEHYSSKGPYTYIIQTSCGTLVADNHDLYIVDAKAERVGSFIPQEIIDPSKLSLNYVNNDVKQMFRYVEVPLVARYKVIDRKLDFNLSGGLAYGFLIENAAYAVVDQKSVKIGHTEGINNRSLSSQMGFGMEYNLSKTISVNLEPVFRYYLTPFSDLSGSVTRPYSVGVFTGFFVKF